MNEIDVDDIPTQGVDTKQSAYSELVATARVVSAQIEAIALEINAVAVDGEQQSKKL